VAAPRQGEQDQADRGDHEHRARIVDAVLVADRRHPQHHADHQQGQHTQRQVEEEDPPPVVLGEVPAGQRAGHRGHREHAPEHALVLGAFPRADQVADDGERERHQPAGAQALDGAERDELPHLLARPGEQ